MHIRTLEYIAAVADLQHFGDAARKCNVSQPTLSMQIKKFEDRYQLILFERTKTSVRLTRAGEKILSSIRALLHEFHNMEAIARLESAPEEGEFVLGAFPTLAPFYLPEIMPALTRRFPNLKLYLVEDRSPALLTRLEEGNLDAALLALPVENQHLYNIYPLFEEPLWAAVPAKSALAGYQMISLKDLKDYPLLLLEDGHCLSGQALEVCEWAGLKNRHDFKATSLETLRQMVGNGIGITLIPDMAVPRQTDSHSDAVRYIRLKEKNANRKIGLVTRKTAPQAEFIAQIYKILHKVYKNH